MKVELGIVALFVISIALSAGIYRGLVNRRVITYIRTERVWVEKSTGLVQRGKFNDPVWEVVGPTELVCLKKVYDSYEN